MYIKDSIAYAGKAPELLKIIKIDIVSEYNANVYFNNGEFVNFDFCPLLKFECYKPLENKQIFESFTLEHGVPVWLDGEIDIAPEYIYDNGVKNIQLDA